MVTQDYRLWYKERGLRYNYMLADPPTITVDRLPLNALVHYVNAPGEGSDIDANELIFQQLQKRIAFHTELDYTETIGVFRKAPLNLKESLRAWRQQYQQKFVAVETPWKTVNDRHTLVVLNYSYLNQAYAYNPLPMASYHQWVNQQVALIDRINQIGETQRHQFVFVDLPYQLVGRVILERFQQQSWKNITPAMYNLLHLENHGGFALLELWKFLHPKTRFNSIWGRILPQHFGKVTLVLRSHQHRTAVVNLGYLNSWIKGEENTSDLSSVSQVDPINLQKLFLKLVMTLNEVQDEDVAQIEQTSASTGLPVSRSQEPATTTPEDEELNQEIQSENDDENTELEPVDVTLNELKPGSKEKLQSLADIEQKESGEKSLNRLEESLRNIDDDLKVLDKLSMKKLAQFEKNDDLPAPEIQLSREEIFTNITRKVAPHEALQQSLGVLAENGEISAADYRKAMQAQESFLNSPDPYGSNQSRKDAEVLKKEDVLITDADSEIVLPAGVPDATMGKSSLKAFDRKYLKTVYRKDMLRMISHLQKAGVIIRDHDIEISHSALGSYEQHVLELKPINGQPSPLKFTLPIPGPEGTFMAGGNKYILRKQRVDLPIRKIAPETVALSTYYGKTFVETSQKVSNHNLQWLKRQINQQSMSQDSFIKEVSPANVFDNYFKAPYIYSAMSESYSSFSAGEFQLVWDKNRRTEIVPENVLKQLEVQGQVVCGTWKGQYPVVVDRKNIFHVAMPQHTETIGDICTLLQLPIEKSPVDFAEVRVFSKYVPVGLVLGYYLGFQNLLTLLGSKHRFVPARKNKELQNHEYAISFKNGSYVFDRRDRRSSMVLAGLMDYEKIIRVYDKEDFDQPDVYLNLLSAKGMSSIYVRELDMMKDMFVDPISEEILETMNEPTTFIGLLIRGSELLLNYNHPDSQDRSAMRERGYERFPGTVYRSLTQAIRQFRNKNLSNRSKINMSPYEIWNAVMKDSAMKVVEDINPIQNLKEVEVMTYAGTGGRDKDNMTKATRAAHVSDFGLLSEATVDSSAVGTIAYLSANPNYRDVRGLMKADKELNPTSILSTSALVSPAATQDNPKRIMFIATQQSHTIASEAYRQPYLRTGYELVLAKRVGQLFAATAEQDGKVVSQDEHGMIIEYLDGEKVGIQLGRQYGRAEGSVYPHDIVSVYTTGQKFKKGSILAYNTKFFEPDFLDPTNIILKMSQVVRTAFIEASETHEDSFSISSRIGKEFKTETTKVKSFVVDFGQNLVDVVTPGQKLTPKSILMTMEDTITSSTQGTFSDSSLATLKRLSNLSPRANVSGVIERIEVFYHGDKRDMSPTLKQLADRSDRLMAQQCKSTNKPVVTGQVTEEYRVSGTPLGLDRAELRFYITIMAPTGVGDKGVFGHQMKGTVAEVMRNEVRTEDGELVDAIFSFQSPAARGVLSPQVMGTAITVLDGIAKKAVSIYFEDQK